MSAQADSYNTAADVPQEYPDWLRVDTGSLSWVLPELRRELDEAQKALREFQQSPQDTTALRLARSHLHQAHGALQMVDLEGVSLITEEAEQLFDGFEQNPEQCTAASVQIIAASFHAVIEYLEELMAGMPHQPLRLYPSYNVLLGIRGAKRIHPADLFYPNLSIRPPIATTRAKSLSAEEVTQERGRFERGLLAFLREDGAVNATDALHEMRIAIAAIEASPKQGQQRAFWWIVRAFFEALEVGALPQDLDVKRLMARINLQMRRLQDDNVTISEGLLRDTLFFVARSKPQTDHIREVQRTYQLRFALPDDFETQRYGQVDMEGVRQAKELVANAKKAWAAVASGALDQIDTFAQESSAILGVSGSFGQAGLAQLASVIANIGTDLSFDPRQPEETIGLDVASALLFLESALDQIHTLDAAFNVKVMQVVARLDASASGLDGEEDIGWRDEVTNRAQQRQSMNQFIAELQENLQFVEKSLDTYFRNQNKRGDLAAAEKMLTQVGGALSLLGHSEVQEAVDSSRASLLRFADENFVADKDEFERVANTLGAIGFYVEQLQHGDGKGTIFSFDAKSGSFTAGLGRAPTNNVVEMPVAHEAAPADIATADSKRKGNKKSGQATADIPVLPVPSTTLEQQTAKRSENVAQLAETLRVNPEDTNARELLMSTLEHMRDDALLLDDNRLGEKAEAAIKLLGEASDFTISDILANTNTGGLSDQIADLADQAGKLAGQHPVAAALIAPSVPVPAINDDVSIDAELLEIFLGEAQEVLQASREGLAQLLDRPSLRDELGNIRRAYHTLKGSGRMVGLNELGEAAWGIEQTLNQQMSESGPVPSAILALIGAANVELESWVGDLLVNQGVSSRRATNLVDYAAAVRAGQPYLFEGTPASSVAPAATTTAALEEEVSFSTDMVEAAPESVLDASVPSFETADTVDLAIDAVVPAAMEASIEAPLEEMIEMSIDMPVDVFADGSAVEMPIEAAAEMPESFEVFMVEPVESVFETVNETTNETTQVGEAMAEFPAEDSMHATDVAGAHWASESDVAPERSYDTRTIGHLTLSTPLYNIFLTEADELLRGLAQDFSEWQYEHQRHGSESAFRSAHSLAGSSATLGLDAVHDLASAVERVLQVSLTYPLPVESSEVQMLTDAVDSLSGMLHRFAAGILPEQDGARIADLNALKDRLQERGQAEVMEQDTKKKSKKKSKQHAQTRQEPVAAAPVAPEVVSEPMLDVQPTEMETVMSEQSPVLEAQAPVAADQGVIESLVAEQPVEPMPADQTPAGETMAADAGPTFAPVQAAPAAPATMSITAAFEASAVQDDIDAELMEIFIEEANDYMPKIGENLRLWQHNTAQPEHAQALLRQLHTVKGSARMAGAMRLGELVHEMESRVELGAGFSEIPQSFFDELLAAHDRGQELLNQLANPTQAQDPAVLAQNQAAAQAQAVIAQAQKTTTFGEGVAVDRSAQTSPVIRVRADLLDRLGNQAGEVSISRARLDNDMGQFKVSLSDLTENLERLRGQLREIEMQAEFQMESQLSLSKDKEHFDPLEFDRFTRFQELTRMMAESVNDVATVQKNLTRSLDGASRNLSTQNRMTRDMQQDLMRIRMVPFSSVAERLYRVVRQSGKELDKRANLDIRGGNVEIDRALLEQMTAPFEHLLRNSVVHGIESRQTRVNAGKPDIGELLIEARHEGNEIVLTFTDDGAGLNLDKIRARAIAVGLAQADEFISDARASEMIFQSGFTTASEITELAGRGVGMDVVRAEVESLNGRVAIESVTGQGTRFTIHLPLTLAVTQVVVVSAGGKRYALPAVLVETVQQIESETLAQCYTNGTVDVNGAAVKLHFLARLLGDNAQPAIAQRQSPVLILRSGGESLAIHVDAIVGNQEAVVKNVGPQLARMPGVAGATVLGSGEVVLILNPVQVEQRYQQNAVEYADNPDTHQNLAARLMEAVQPAAPVQLETVSGLETLPLVMVVDDSLTVRRVTQRLLVRENFQVVLAKDGIDALEQMQDFTPDVMLVDIEMPRMDGFDLTRHIRADERYKDIPIIMITSRTADKHRQYAMELGVNVYLGKPYQDTELIKNIQTFIEQKQRVPA